VRIALFGGTFDPIHAGHLETARTAARQYRLDQVVFVPTGSPPHKYGNRLTPFCHRLAMVALACAGERRFIPSLLEAPTSDGRPHYSIQTTLAMKRALRRQDHLFFLIGIDAFLDLPHWRQYRRLLDEVDFIVVSRPGFDADEIRSIVPKGLLDATARHTMSEVLRLRHTALYLLRGVDVPVASRDIREAVRRGRPVTGLVPPLVEEYIRKEGLYGPAAARRGRR